MNISTTIARRSIHKISKFHRSLSTITSVPPKSNDNNIQKHVTTILQSTILHVPKYGFSDDAIAAAVLSSNLPPSYAGLITNGPLGIVSHVMTKFNRDLRDESLPALRKVWEEDGTSLANRIETAVRARLEMIAPLVRAKRWHEGMAMGATANPVETARQLDELVGIIIQGTGCPFDTPPDRMAIGGVYVATELHMVADQSDEFRDTWAFLTERVRELEMIGGVREGVFPGGSGGAEMATAVTAVASSLGGAVLSLGVPVARGAVGTMVSTVLPAVSQFGNTREQKTNYESANKADEDLLKDLPPFEDSDKNVRASESGGEKTIG